MLWNAVKKWTFTKRRCIRGEIRAEPGRLFASPHDSLSFLLPLPPKIKRCSCQNDSGPDQRLFCLFHHSVDGPYASQYHIEPGQPRVSGAAIRTRRVGLLASQNKERCHGQNVTEHHHKHHVSEEFFVRSAERQRR